MRRIGWLLGCAWLLLCCVLCQDAPEHPPASLQDAVADVCEPSETWAELQGCREQMGCGDQHVQLAARMAERVGARLVRTLRRLDECQQGTVTVPWLHASIDKCKARTERDLSALETARSAAAALKESLSQVHREEQATAQEEKDRGQALSAYAERALAQDAEERKEQHGHAAALSALQGRVRRCQTTLDLCQKSKHLDAENAPLPPVAPESELLSSATVASDSAQKALGDVKVDAGAVSASLMKAVGGGGGVGASLLALSGKKTQQPEEGEVAEEDAVCAEAQTMAEAATSACQMASQEQSPCVHHARLLHSLMTQWESALQDASQQLGECLTSSPELAQAQDIVSELDACRQQAHTTHAELLSAERTAFSLSAQVRQLTAREASEQAVLQATAKSLAQLEHAGDDGELALQQEAIAFHTKLRLHERMLRDCETLLDGCHASPDAAGLVGGSMDVELFYAGAGAAGNAGATALSATGVHKLPPHVCFPTCDALPQRFLDFCTEVTAEGGSCSAYQRVTHRLCRRTCLATHAQPCKDKEAFCARSPDCHALCLLFMNAKCPPDDAGQDQEPPPADWKEALKQAAKKKAQAEVEKTVNPCPQSQLPFPLRSAPPPAAIPAVGEGSPPPLIAAPYTALTRTQRPAPPAHAGPFSHGPSSAVAGLPKLPKGLGSLVRFHQKHSEHTPSATSSRSFYPSGAHQWGVNGDATANGKVRSPWAAVGAENRLDARDAAHATGLARNARSSHDAASSLSASLRFRQTRGKASVAPEVVGARTRPPRMPKLPGHGQAPLVPTALRALDWGQRLARLQ